jgi:hypothetical protein
MSEYQHALRMIWGFLSGALMTIFLLFVATLVAGNLYHAFIGPVNFWAVWQGVAGIGLMCWLGILACQGVAGLKRGVRSDETLVNERECRAFAVE